MKILWSLVVWMVASAACEAKIGEAPFECDARYGQPERIYEALGFKTRQYSFNSYKVTVAFENNFSVVEHISPKTKGEAMSEVEVRALMEAVSGTTNWGEFQTPKLFSKVAVAKAEKLHANWSWKLLGDHTLMIMTEAAVKQANAQSIADEKAKAAGFGGPLPEPVSAAASAPTIVIPNTLEVYLNVDPRPPSGEQLKIEANRVASLLAQATNGVASAQYDLAQRYLTGKGVEKDPLAARAWLEKAASKGHTYAKRALANLPPAEESK